MLNKQIEQLNNVLGSELGRNIMGEPTYAWMYSEDWFHLYLSETDLDIKEQPGSGLVVCEKQVKTRKMCPEYHEQYVIAKWCDAGPEYQWIQKFGDKLPWPRRGYMAPTNIVLEPGVRPDMAVTLQIIGLLRQEKKKTFADYVNESSDSLARNEAKDMNNAKDMIADACTAFGNPKPGSRSAGISFPSVANR